MPTPHLVRKGPLYSYLVYERYIHIHRYKKEEKVDRDLEEEGGDR